MINLSPCKSLHAGLPCLLTSALIVHVICTCTAYAMRMCNINHDTTGGSVTDLVVVKQSEFLEREESGALLKFYIRLPSPAGLIGWKNQHVVYT